METCNHLGLLGLCPGLLPQAPLTWHGESSPLSCPGGVLSLLLPLAIGCRRDPHACMTGLVWGLLATGYPQQPGVPFPGPQRGCELGLAHIPR